MTLWRWDWSTIVKYRCKSVRLTQDYSTKVNFKFANLVAIKVEELDEYISKGGDVTEKFSALGKVKSLAENPNAKASQQAVADDSESEDDQWWSTSRC